jgi:hypothetical protein
MDLLLSRRLTFVQALYRAAIASDGFCGIVRSLGFVASRPLQVAMRAESAFVEAVMRSRGRLPSDEDLTPADRALIIATLNAAGISAELIALSKLRTIGLDMRGGINIVEFDADASGFGFICNPIYAAKDPHRGAFTYEKELGEVFAAEATAVFLGRNGTRLQECVMAQMRKTHATVLLLERLGADERELAEKLEASRRARSSLSIQAGQVDISIKAAEARIVRLQELRARLEATAEDRQAENAAIVFEAKIDRDAAQAGVATARAAAAAHALENLAIARLAAAAESKTAALHLVVEPNDATRDAAVSAAAVSKSKRKEAERQRKEAERQRKEAERQRDEARRQCEEARRQRDEAESRREAMRLDLVAAERAVAAFAPALAAKREVAKATQDELSKLSMQIGGLRGALKAASAEHASAVITAADTRAAIDRLRLELRRECLACLDRLE